MYIMVPTGMQIINSNFVERFCVVEKPDAALVVASYDRSTVGAHTLGRYADVREAQEALGELLVALAGGQTCCTTGSVSRRTPASRDGAAARRHTGAVRPGRDAGAIPI